MSVESCDQTCSVSRTNGPNSREAASCQRMSMEEVSKGDSSIRDLKMDLDKYSTTPDTESTPTACAEDNGYLNACTPPVFSTIGKLKYPSLAFQHPRSSPNRCPLASIHLSQETYWRIE